MKWLNKWLLLILLGNVILVSAQEIDNGNSDEYEKFALSIDIQPAAIRPGSIEADLSKKEFGKEYFPFDTLKEYFFKSSLGDTKAIFESVADGVVLTFDAPNMEYRQTLVKETNGVFLKRTEISALLFFGNDIKYVEPVLRIPFPLRDGDSWEWNALETEDEDTTSLVICGEVLGQERIFTPYGEFDCVKIRQHITSENGSDNIVTEWFAPGIGLVKSHAILEGTGITGFIQSIFGFDEVIFELAAIGKRSDY